MKYLSLDYQFFKSNLQFPESGVPYETSDDVSVVGQNDGICGPSQGVTSTVILVSQHV